MAIVIPKVRNIMILNIVTILIPAALWIGSIYVEGEGKKQGLIWVAIVWGTASHLESGVTTTNNHLPPIQIFLATFYLYSSFDGPCSYRTSFIKRCFAYSPTTQV